MSVEHSVARKVEQRAASKGKMMVGCLARHLDIQKAGQKVVPKVEKLESWKVEHLAGWKGLRLDWSWAVHLAVH